MVGEDFEDAVERIKKKLVSDERETYFKKWYSSYHKNYQREQAKPEGL